MANNSYGELFDLIREKCQRENWYGPDGDNIYQYGEKYRRRRWYDWDRNFHVVDKENDPLRFGFEYPPATEEQLLATEEALGFPLPPALRALYLQVANGGFGPGYDIDRKSTRLNSSHQIISYAVFCLKKKKLNHKTQCRPPH